MTEDLLFSYSKLKEFSKRNEPTILMNPADHSDLEKSLPCQETPSLFEAQTLLGMKIYAVPEFERKEALIISDKTFLELFFQNLGDCRKSSRPGAAREYVKSILAIAERINGKKE